MNLYDRDTAGVPFAGAGGNVWEGPKRTSRAEQLPSVAQWLLQRLALAKCAEWPIDSYVLSLM